MKLRITLNDGDGIWDSLERSPLVEDAKFLPVTERDRDAIISARIEYALNVTLLKWIESSETITIEFDTEAMTARVLEWSELCSK